MPGSPMLKSAFTDLHDARFREVFDDKYENYDTYYEKIFQVETSDKSYEQYSSVSGHTLMQPKGEGSTSQTDARIQGYDVQFVNNSYSLEAELSYENIKDDQFKILNKEAAALGKSAKRTPDAYAADAFKRGFATTDSYGNAQVAADGKPFFSTLHPKNPSETGTTYSNASASGITLTEDNLETGILALQQQLNPKGLLLQSVARVLVVPMALRKTAILITGSDKRSNTADNDANPYKGFERYYGGTMDVVVWPQLDAVNLNGSATAWFLLDPEIHELIFQWRERPNVWPVEFNKKGTGEFIYTCFARFEYGMVDWRGTWGSKGDGQAYSA
jgi:phage major head subunit gpT-like protein